MMKMIVRSGILARGTNLRIAMVLVISLMSQTGAKALEFTGKLDGWWVVLASIKDDDGPQPHQKVEALRKSMLACDIRIFNDFSWKFVGFTKGYLVVVVGAYASEAAARSKLPEVRACAPEAYVKRARYLGE
jgi:hypothetical protein